MSAPGNYKLPFIFLVFGPFLRRSVGCYRPSIPCVSALSQFVGGISSWFSFSWSLSTDGTITAFATIFPVLVKSYTPVPIVPPMPFADTIFIAKRPSALCARVFILYASIVTTVAYSTVKSLPRVATTVSLFSFEAYIVSSFALLLSPGSSVLFVASGPLFTATSSGPMVLSFARFAPKLSAVAVLPPSNF